MNAVDLKRHREAMGLALILDMDGLMLDTEPIALRAVKQASHELGYAFPDDVFERMIGLSAQGGRDVLRHHFGDTFPAETLGTLAATRYQEYLDVGGVPHKPGLEDFLQFIDARRIPRAVATSTATDLATLLLRQAGVAHYFEIVVGGDQVSRGKPEPDIFLVAAERLGHRPVDCAVLEDSGPGIQAAAAAGMKSILIPDRRVLSRDIRSSAHAIAESLSDAKRIVEGLLDERAN